MKLLLICLLPVSASYAQTRLIGKVNDEQGKPVPYANVLVINAGDSALVKGGVASSDGLFAIERLRPGHYRVAVTGVGYQKSYSPPFILTTGNGTHQLLPLTATANAKQLNEVQVMTQKPLFEQQIDRLIINVQSSISSAGSTVLDMLERSPGVMVDRQNNTLAMNGKQGVMVMLNGKLTRLPMNSVMQLLGGMNAGNIEKIELITTPPAQYDAEGNAGLINIVTKRSPNIGTNGSLSANFGYGKWERAGLAVNVNRRGEKLSVFADYSGQMNHFLRPSGGSRTLSLPVPTETIYTIRRDERDWIHNGQAGMELALTDRTTLSSLATVQNIQSNQLAYNNSLTTRLGQPLTRVAIRDDELNDTWIYTANLNLRHKLKKQQTLSTDLDYIRFVNNNPHRYLFSYEYPQENRNEEETVNNEKRTPLRLWVAKADYSRTISRKVNVETGLKGTFAHFDNDIQFERLQNGTRRLDSALTQHVQMDETIWAGYVNISQQFTPKTRLQAGLRYEHTETDLHTSNQQALVYRNYGSWFPSVFIAHELTQTSSIQWSYSRRISRPTFGQLAPFFTFVEPNYTLGGNERLLPALSNNIQAIYRFRKNFLLTLDYTQLKNYITYNLRIIPNENRQIIRPENLEQANNLALTFSFPVPVTAWWQMQTNVQGVRQEARLTLEGITLRQQLMYGRIGSTQTFRLPGKLTAELSGFYQSRSLLGVAARRPFGALNVGLQKQLANNRGTLRLAGEDVLWTNRLEVETASPAEGYTAYSNFLSHNRLVRLTYSRSFGNQKVVVNSKRATGSDDERKRMN
ncbi:TonB-dependent receptor domain-containing protein [Spirosoma areae]